MAASYILGGISSLKLVFSITESKIFKSTISEAKRKASTNNCKISFLNKSVVLIDVPYIFHDPSLKSCLPTDIKFDDFTVVCRL